mmetsp:Transcript_78203/g.253891  ORF Transcript_78203/g.253891 Transcript_78203/m.253891 type:complete len:220 (+) Transcript_78203:639-1298(+)
MVGREPERPPLVIGTLERRELHATTRATGAHHADDLGGGKGSALAFAGDDNVALAELGEATGAALCQHRPAISMDATAVPVVVRRHSDGRRGRGRQTRARRGARPRACGRAGLHVVGVPNHLVPAQVAVLRRCDFWSRHGVEGLVGGVTQLLEELRTVQLDARILEVVTLLHFVRRCHRRNVVSAPPVVVFGFRECLRALTQHILQQGRDFLVLGRRRC